MWVGWGGLLFKKHNAKLYFLSFADLLDKMLLILLGVLVLHLIILILLTVATAASVSALPQSFRLKKKCSLELLSWNDYM